MRLVPLALATMAFLVCACAAFAEEAAATHDLSAGLSAEMRARVAGSMAAVEPLSDAQLMTAVTRAVELQSEALMRMAESSTASLASLGAQIWSDCAAAEKIDLVTSPGIEEGESELSVKAKAAKRENQAIRIALWENAEGFLVTHAKYSNNSDPFLMKAAAILDQRMDDAKARLFVEATALKCRALATDPDHPQAWEFAQLFAGPLRQGRMEGQAFASHTDAPVLDANTNGD
jgi:hypothetical protein